MAKIDVSFVGSFFRVYSKSYFVLVCVYLRSIEHEDLFLYMFLSIRK